MFPFFLLDSWARLKLDSKVLEKTLFLLNYKVEFKRKDLKALDYLLNDKQHKICVEGSPDFRYGEAKVLSNAENDATFHQKWYSEGYNNAPFLNEADFLKLKNGITESIEQLIQKELSIDTKGFELSNYHRYVKDEAGHQLIASKTRDLFAGDFVFSVQEIIERLEKILGFELTDNIPQSDQKLHIIVRINRPQSKDFNPPHKDIYEAVDNYSMTPKLINFWIPITGVTERSSLPISPKSHLISEDKILRSFEGCVINGNKYHVRTVQSWEGSNSLIRSDVNYGEVLVFSSYLIHGLAINEETDLTRVSLEFRLFQKE